MGPARISPIAIKMIKAIRNTRMCLLFHRRRSRPRASAEETAGVTAAANVPYEQLIGEIGYLKPMGKHPY